MTGSDFLFFKSIFVCWALSAAKTLMINTNTVSQCIPFRSCCATDCVRKLLWKQFAADDGGKGLRVGAGILTGLSSHWRMMRVE